MSQKAYCLRYVDISETDKALIIGVSVAVGVILLLLVIICLYVLVKRQRRKNRKKKKQQQQESDDDNSITASREEINYEDRSSQKSEEPDYLETLPDATEPRLEGPGVDVSDVTFHRPASYYNDAADIVDNDELVPEEDPTQRMWDYEPNDEALTFDLKQVKFDRVTPKLPTFSFDVDPRQSTVSFT